MRKLALAVLAAAVICTLTWQANPERPAVAAPAEQDKLVQGDAFGCLLRTNGTIWCWGDNADGQLGDGTTVNRPSPVQVLGITNAVSITAGNHHTCALLGTGEARCWGRNTSGQLGDGTTAAPDARNRLLFRKRARLPCLDLHRDH